MLANLVDTPSNNDNDLPISKFVACVRTEASRGLLTQRFGDKLSVRINDNVAAAQEADIIILGVDPADLQGVLKQPGLCAALSEKLVISIAAGWTGAKIEETLYGDKTTAENQAGRAWILRALPNIAASVSQSLTAIAVSEPKLPDQHLQLAESILQRIGQTVQVPPSLMDATTAVAGSTPAFFSIICDALIDASVAVGMPRATARQMIFQSMKGTAKMLQSGVHTGVLRDQGTCPEGCTIAGIMVLEENAVRGHVGKALREAVTVTRLMENVRHVNDTRQ
jgi:pyrroline-5-carboxylate reductase